MPLDRLAKKDAQEKPRRVKVVTPRPGQIRSVMIIGTAKFPLQWTEKDIGHHLAGVFAVPHAQVGVKTVVEHGNPNRMICVKGATLPWSFVQGGGRVQRVQHHSLEQVVVGRLVKDLEDSKVE
eukprot:5197862-Amphidinium_carterae.1